MLNDLSSKGGVEEHVWQPPFFLFIIIYGKGSKQHVWMGPWRHFDRDKVLWLKGNELSPSPPN